MARDIDQWLEGLGLSKYSGLFAENDIDWEILPDLEERDLEKLGLSLGHRKKLLKAIAKLSEDAGTVDHSAEPAVDQRLTMRLMAHWHKLRGNRRCPLVSEFLSSIPPELLPDCFNFVSGKSLDEGRLSLGSNVARFSGITKTSLLLAEVPGNTLLGAAIRSLEDALKGKPITESGEFEDGRSNQYLYRAILLPLEDDEGEVIQVICGAGCKARPIKA